MLRFGSNILLCVLAVACVGQRGNDIQATAASRDSLKTFLESYYEVMSSRDWKKYRDFFWEDATITASWQKAGDTASMVHIITIDQFIAETPAGPDSQPVFSERMKDASIEVRGHLASAWVDYDVEFGKPDSLKKWSGTDVFTLLKDKGNWRIASLVFQSN